MIFERIHSEDYEQIVYCNDSRTRLKAIISMHSTILGPAVGGCRMWNYASEQEALTDVLRLSKGMTYKAAISGLNWGGGKAVIIGDPKTAKTSAMLERFGEYVERLGGHYVTAKDVGIGAEDLRQIKTKSQYVLGIDGEKGSSGDPSPATSWGVYHGMRACVKKAFGTNTMGGLTIAMQGLGSVAYYLLEHLAKDGAKVIGCDVDAAAVDRAVKKYGIEVTRPESIYDVKCDIFSPNALGASINAATLPRLHTKIIAGGANNQLENDKIGFEVMKRGILYAPDYALNAGGLTNIYHESAVKGGYDRARAFDRVAKVYDTITSILQRAMAENMPTHVVADRMAEERVNAGRKR
jgi:leucine dehydrogenase